MVSTSVFGTDNIGSIPIERWYEYCIVVITSDFQSDDLGSNPSIHKDIVYHKNDNLKIK